MKLLLLDERYPLELLSGFEVVLSPQDDVVAALTIGEPVGKELFAQLPALRVVSACPASVLRMPATTGSGTTLFPLALAFEESRYIGY